RGESIDHFEAIRVRKDGSLLDTSETISPLRDSSGQVVGASEIARDITRQKLEQLLIRSQSQALQLLAEDAPLEKVLGFLTDAAERLSPSGMLASILLVNEAGTHFERGIGASLPDAYNAAVEGFGLSSPIGPCATAARLQEEVAVHDFNAGPWQPFGEFVAPYGIRSGWSVPILSANGKVLGTFANLYRHTGDPTPKNRELVDMVVRTAAIVIEQKRTQEKLRKSHDNLEQLIEQRTAAIRQLSLSLLRSQDDERRRISRELHDSLGQYLASAKMNVYVLNRPGTTEKETQRLSS